jgi:glyoxylase-like metal-dependent hydrolase (beta-lactamase superfamily II)
MAQQVPVDEAAVALDFDGDDVRDDGTHEIFDDVAYKRLAIVNVVFVGRPGAQWVLVDCGVPGSAGAIRRAAAARFGDHARPLAIVMTHGHFDHAGAMETLAEEWDVPVYAHPLEIPYLNGSASYPPPDPSVGGGMMALMSPLYPRGPFNAGARLRVLPEDGSLPYMPGWNWLRVPGHTPGQIALWRENDRTLLPADAFITTAQESAYAVALQKPELHGPPKYYTQNWIDARESVQRLAALEPETVITGHGLAMQGEAMRTALNELAARFDELAVPDHGKYVEIPTDAVSGTAYDSG